MRFIALLFMLWGASAIGVPAVIAFPLVLVAFIAALSQPSKGPGALPKARRPNYLSPQWRERERSLY